MHPKPQVRAGTRAGIQPTVQLPLKSSGGNNDDNNQASDNQGAGNGTDDDDTAPAGGEFASDYIVLALKVAVEAQQQDQNGNAEEGCAEGFANLAQAGAV